MKKMWIVVADERRAMLYLSGALREPFALLQTIENDGDAPDRELETDRPGRTFSSSTGQRHGVDGERSTRRMAKHDEPAIRAHVPQETWRELGR